MPVSKNKRKGNARNKAPAKGVKSRMGGLRLLSNLKDVEQSEILLDFRASIDAMRTGRGKPDHFNTLVYAANVAQVLSDRGLGHETEYRESIYQTKLALARCKKRGAETGKWALDGEGIKALDAFEPLHEAQMEGIKQVELKWALEEMHKRLAGGPDFLQLLEMGEEPK